MAIDLIKVFSATKARDRGELGDRATAWIDDHKNNVVIVDKIVTQSSDNEFHCLSITLFCSRRRHRQHHENS